MKIRDLFNLEKAIEEKKEELDDLKFQLEETKKLLESLQEEQTFIECMIDYNENNMNNNSALLKIDINNTYVYNDKGINHFVTIKNSMGLIKLRDILNNDLMLVYSDERRKLKLLVTVYPEILTYMDGNVPLTLLQKLYYESNGIDSKVLKKAKINE